MPSLFVRVLPVFCLVLMAGCAPRQVRQPLEVEVVTVDELARQELDSIPLNFSIPFEEVSYGWQRARSFFKNHTGSFLGERKLPGDTLLLSNAEANDDKYVYEVLRISSLKGAAFQVSCQSRVGDGADYSLTNAKNLARFIRDGVLEGSLLDR